MIGARCPYNYKTKFLPRRGGKVFPTKNFACLATMKIKKCMLKCKNGLIQQLFVKLDLPARKITVPAHL